MVKVRDIPRTATFAWSPGTISPLIATGTRAGAVDADFSNNTQLEVWDVAPNHAKQSQEFQSLASIETDSRFHDLAWAQPSDDYPQGVIAGALENGSLDLWDAGILINGNGNAFLSRTSKHSGAIKALQFNPFRPGLLASAGAKGELFISDLNNISNPYRMGNAVARADDFDCLDWNKNVPHIMVTGSNGGFVTVWDVKTKRESLTLNNMGRKAVSAVAWDPNKHTRLITAIPLDTDPLILVWDLRNSNAPERVLRGHDGGVLSISWCSQDNDLLLSCGKDNRTICWNPQSGEPHGELPIVTNWTFQTRWNPHNPSFLATASFDGKISVQSIQNTGTDIHQSTGDQEQILNDEDFFDNTQSKSQSSSFSLTKAPKWMERPCGVSFGFGGKVVSFNVPNTSGQRNSSVHIANFSLDAGIGIATEIFENALQKKDLTGICQTKISEARNETDKLDWKIMETLSSANPRDNFMGHLGFPSNRDEALDGIITPADNGGEDVDSESSKPNGVVKPKNNRLSAFFETNVEDSFLSDLAATKGAKINNPFQVYSGTESEPDRKVTRALLLGQFDKALDVCLQEDRISDALMIAICGGQSCVERAQQAYFNRKDRGPNYLRLLASVVGKNLWDLVYNANLENWKEIMAALCTYANTDEFPDLCEALGDRLEEAAKTAEIQKSSRKDALFCYMAGSKLDKTIAIWIREFEEYETSESENHSNESSFSIHARSLQAFVEKATIFREVTKFQDQERQSSADWKLSLLYDKYTEYADLLASYGQLRTAQRYLELLPEKYPAAEVAKNRIRQAIRKPTTQPVAKQPPATGWAANNRGTPIAGAPSFENLTANVSAPNTSNSYAPPSGQVQNHYAPAKTSAYGLPPTYSDNSGYRQPHQATSLLGPPPRNLNASSSITAPSKATNMANWNDTPESFFKPPTPRRGTPSGYGTTANMQHPYSGMPGGQPLPGPLNVGPQKSSSVLSPPPKGPPRTSSPMTTSSLPHPPHDRPSSSAAGAYAPPQQSSKIPAGQQYPAIPRGPSPYNPPPSAPPPNNRYAPIAHSTASNFQTDATTVPGDNRGPPPPNPYAPQETYLSNQHHASIAPSSTPKFPPSAGPPPRSLGPPMATTQGPPLRGSGQETVHSRQMESVSDSPTTKYPPGDRSHIPSNARPILELLSTDMQRVKARAPANFEKQVNDTEKRLGILFDHLNNDDLLKNDTVASMVELSQALHARNYEQAQAIHLDILTNKTDQCGQWMVGVKRLIAMSRSTP